MATYSKLLTGPRTRVTRLWFTFALSSCTPQPLPDDMFVAPDLASSQDASSSCRGFSEPSSYPAGRQPNTVVIADLNGDGKPDVATSDGLMNTLSVLTGNGDGTFTAGDVASTPGASSALSAADLNGDGHVDLIATAANQVVVFLYRGLDNGQPLFAAGVGYPVGALPTSIAVGDLDGDGYSDIVTNGGGDVNVLLNHGDGTFANPTKYPLVAPSSVAIGDLNGDGKPDLAVTHTDTNSGVSVLLATGNGMFNAPVSYAAGSDPIVVNIADLNGDKHQDLVVANQLSSVSVLLGKGDGTFGKNAEYPSMPFSMMVGDINRDTRVDILITGNGTFGVLLGNGDGTLSPPESFPAGADPVSVALGDLNADGVPDVAVANGSADMVSLLLGCIW